MRRWKRCVEHSRFIIVWVGGIRTGGIFFFCEPERIELRCVI